MNSGLNKTRLPLLPQQALQHLSQWEPLLGQTSFEKGGAWMCCRVTRSDVTCVYFQHIHVNVDRHTHTHTTATVDACTYCSLHAKIFACTVQYHWMCTDWLSYGSLPHFCKLVVSLASRFLVWSVDDNCCGMYVHTHTHTQGVCSRGNTGGD